MNRYSQLIALTAMPQLIACATLDPYLGSVFKQPTVSFKQAHLKDVSFEDLTVDFELEVDNPNQVGLSLAGIDYQLSLDGKQLFKGEDASGVQVKAASKSSVRVPVNIKFTDFVENLAVFFSKRDEIPYALEAGVGLSTPIGPVRVPVGGEGKLPLPKPPEVSVKGVRLADLNLGGAKIEFALDVANRSKFPIRVKGLAYDIAVSGASLSKGEHQVGELSAEATQPLTIPVELSFLGLSSAVVRAIQTKKLPYEVKGSLDLGVFSQPFDLRGNANL